MSKPRVTTPEQDKALAEWYSTLRSMGSVQQKAKELGISVCAVYDAISRGLGKPTAGTRFKLASYLKDMSAKLREPLPEVPCGTCGLPHRRYRSDGRPQAWCAPCHAAYMREHRPKHSELTEEQRIKANARAYANTYQRRGKLKKEPCSVCGSMDSQKHHTDYSQPLKVVWLCREHHLDEHVQKESA
jgi:hypothetical protein